MKTILTVLLLFVAARVSGQTIIADTIDVHNPINCKHFPKPVHYDVTFKGPNYGGWLNIALPTGYTTDYVKNQISCRIGFNVNKMVIVSVKKREIENRPMAPTGAWYSQGKAK